MLKTKAIVSAILVLSALFLSGCQSKVQRLSEPVLVEIQPDGIFNYEIWKHPDGYYFCKETNSGKVFLWKDVRWDDKE